ncbi:MAG TPA: hypothetical protein VFZ78_01050, partial [Flavisolibacter sp.]
MKKSVSLFLGVLSVVFVQAQSPTAAEYRNSGQRMIAYQTLPDEQKETVQGRFIQQVWSPGEVRFRKTDKVMQVPLIFDVYSNQLYYLQNGIIMEFVEPVREFRMQLNMEKDSVTFVFRCTYPDIDKNTGETFYEVITDGRFQLLRCKAK